jgi:Holliday junction resolvasome RuvABC endonuclease subunit
MNILALDLGSHTGWALKRGDVVESGVQKFDLRRGESRGMRYIRFNAWLQEMLAPKTASYPDLVIYEMAHHRGGAATEVLLGMVTRVMEQCAEREINCTDVHSGTLKKHATGKGNADKEQMKVALMKKMSRPGSMEVIGAMDDNEVDALWILKYAEDTYETEGGGV